MELRGVHRTYSGVLLVHQAVAVIVQPCSHRKNKQLADSAAALA